MEPRTDNLTTKCSVALLTLLLTLNLYWYPKLISCYIWKRESGIIWKENGMICSARSTLQTIRHKFWEHGHQERKTRRWKLKKGQNWAKKQQGKENLGQLLNLLWSQLSAPSDWNFFLPKYFEIEPNWFFSPLSVSAAPLTKKYSIEKMNSELDFSSISFVII